MNILIDCNADPDFLSHRTQSARAYNQQARWHQQIQTQQSQYKFQHPECYRQTISEAMTEDEHAYPDEYYWQKIITLQAIWHHEQRHARRPRSDFDDDEESLYDYYGSRARVNPSRPR